ncbi:hypothetical protein [Azospirillum tabaci]|uniref:hypothetical protein n=1 Tax=Azospirillum tabaci TaxID=2752310 RepID=UPI00166101EC|nr:hypothetical protein [Azospirillum tabaci]
MSEQEQEQKPTVVKGFNTPSRRFAVGQPVAPQDIDGPVSFDRLVELEHIALPKPAKAGKGSKATPAEPDAVA